MQTTMASSERKQETVRKGRRKRRKAAALGFSQLRDKMWNINQSIKQINTWLGSAAGQARPDSRDFYWSGGWEGERRVRKVREPCRMRPAILIGRRKKWRKRKAKEPCRIWPIAMRG